MRKMLSIAVLLGANLAAAAQTDMPKPAQDFALPREGESSWRRAQHLLSSQTMRRSTYCFGTEWARVRDQRKTLMTWQLFWQVR
jgi:hypothetical protein